MAEFAAAATAIQLADIALRGFLELSKFIRDVSNAPEALRDKIAQLQAFCEEEKSHLQRWGKLKEKYIDEDGKRTLEVVAREFAAVKREQEVIFGKFGVDGYCEEDAIIRKADANLSRRSWKRVKGVLVAKQRDVRFVASRASWEQWDAKLDAAYRRLRNATHTLNSCLLMYVVSTTDIIDEKTSIILETAKRHEDILSQLVTDFQKHLPPASHEKETTLQISQTTTEYTLTSETVSGKRISQTKYRQSWRAWGYSVQFHLERTARYSSSNFGPWQPVLRPRRAVAVEFVNEIGEDMVPRRIMAGAPGLVMMRNVAKVGQYLRNGWASVDDVVYGGLWAGTTLLHIATRLTMVDMCKLLIEEGADVDAVDDHGCTPMDICLETTKSTDDSPYEWFDEQDEKRVAIMRMLAKRTKILITLKHGNGKVLNMRIMQWLHAGEGAHLLNTEGQTLSFPQQMGMWRGSDAPRRLMEMLPDSSWTPVMSTLRFGNEQETYLGYSIHRLCEYYKLFGRILTHELEFMQKILAASDDNWFPELGTSPGTGNAHSHTALDEILGFANYYTGRIYGYTYDFNPAPLLLAWLATLHKSGKSLHKYFEMEGCRHEDGVIQLVGSHRPGVERHIDVEFGKDESDVTLAVEDVLMRDPHPMPDAWPGDRWCLVQGEEFDSEDTMCPRWSLSTSGFQHGNFDFERARVKVSTVLVEYVLLARRFAKRADLWMSHPFRSVEEIYMDITAREWTQPKQITLAQEEVHEIEESPMTRNEELTTNG